MRRRLLPPISAGGAVKDPQSFGSSTGAAASPPSQLHRVRSPELRSAAARAVGRWPGAGDDPCEEESLVETAALILEVLEDRVEPPSLQTDEPAALVLRRRMIDAIRGELVRHPPEEASGGDDGSATRLLTFVRRLEELREALDPDWSQDFEASLLGPDGLELTTEVCHDLRSPLSSVLFLAETLRGGKSGDLNEVQRRQIGLIYSASLSMLSIVSDVIELCRGGDELDEREPGPFSVRQVLDSVKEMAAPMAEEKGLTFQVSGPEADVRLGHSVALSRVLLNLTTNAIKFTDDGFVEVRARGEAPDRVRFEVRDTGQGIEPEMQGHLFEAFRLSDRKQGYRFSGTGLGLTIARKLVEAMGSRLHFETRPGEGTTFHFTLSLPMTDAG